MVLGIENYLQQSTEDKDDIEAFHIKSLEYKMEIRTTNLKLSYKSFYEFLYEIYSKKFTDKQSNEEKYILSEKELNLLSDTAYQDIKECFNQKNKYEEMKELINFIKNDEFLLKIEKVFSEIDFYNQKIKNIELEKKISTFLEYFSIQSSNFPIEKKLEECGEVLKITENICRKFNEVIIRNSKRNQVAIVKETKVEMSKFHTLSNNEKYISPIRRVETNSKTKSSVYFANGISKKYNI